MELLDPCLNTREKSGVLSVRNESATSNADLKSEVTRNNLSFTEEITIYSGSVKERKLCLEAEKTLQRRETLQSVPMPIDRHGCETRRTRSPPKGENEASQKGGRGRLRASDYSSTTLA